MTFSRLRTNTAGGLYPGNFTNAATGSGTGYKYVSFTASGTLTVDVGGLFDILVVGGGGSSGLPGTPLSSYYQLPGGAGGGGVISTTAYLSAGTYTVTIGAGATKIITPQNDGRMGNASSLGKFTAMGGGGSSAGYNFCVNQVAGCGGGGSAQQSNQFTPSGYTAAQGYAGGTAFANASNSSAGGGGGGAGAAGANGTSAVGGAGGAGLLSTITGSNVYYGGGGGGLVGVGTYGTGGSGGGATASSTTAADATANTGGGGAPGFTSGGNGGSGIVIVRVNY